MIVCNLPPSFFLGSLATAIRTPAFNCLLATSRNGWCLNHWAAFIFEGDPSVDKRPKLCGSVGYKRGLAKAARLTAHQELAERLDTMGEQGMPLELALKSIFHDFQAHGIIEPSCDR